MFTRASLDARAYIIVENGFLSSYYSLFVMVYVIAPSVMLWRKYVRTNDPSTRTQLRYLLIGFLAFFCTATLTNSVLPVFFGIYFFNAIGPVFSLILAAFVFYIIWRHEFLDIKIIIQRGLVYIALSAPLVAAYFGLNFGLGSLFFLSPHTNALFSAFATLCVAALAIYAVERYFEKVSLLKVEQEYAAQLEREVAERTRHLKELQEYQRRMMDDISHAIQTPITVIQSSMEEVWRDMQHVKTYHIMERSIDDLSRLARDFLHLSRLETLPEIRRVPFSLSDMIVEIAEYMGVVCKENGITLRKTIEGGLTIHADKSQIEELLRNLLSNAIKHTRHAKKRNITIDVRREGNEALVRIEDTGSGIAGSALPHIFERFFRANDSPQGVGLGLSICERITELHSGSITVESIEGQGATFTVHLPTASVAQVIRLS